jgi:cytochrome P450
MVATRPPVDGWRDGEVRNVHDDMMRVTMEIVSKTLFDADVETDVDELGRVRDRAPGDCGALPAPSDPRLGADRQQPALPGGCGDSTT